MKFRTTFGSVALLASLAYAQSGSTVPDPSIPPVQTTVTVNGTLPAESPAQITVVPNAQLQTIPGTELDDRLRQIPGFSLFRRSSSVVANPTTQGVSLRGIGSSGASRTLVLWDGIPLNDPFGGWVYWDRLDPNFIDRIEVQPGAPTSVFGDRAMSGTISVFSPSEQHQHVSADFLAGNEGTVDLSGSYSNLWGPWGLTVHSREFTTDGYYIVPGDIRGTVDQKANVRFATGDTHLDYLGTSDRLSLHIDILAEERQNGTVLTHNSTGLGTVGLTYTHSWTNDQISFTAFHTQEQFHSTFSSVGANRDTESLTSRQTVPEYDYGGAVYWRHHAKRWNLIGGEDTDDIHGTSFDYSYFRHTLTPNGGTLLQHGTFGEADVTFGPVRFYGGIRHQFTGRGDNTFLSPNAGATVGLGKFRLRASGYRSFRAPSLNELFRPFQVGNALTAPNPNLVPESMVGEEAGIDYVGENTHVSASAFHNDLNNLIGNATLRVTPTQIMRQRQNFSGAFSQGFEANLNQRWRAWSVQAGYMFVDAHLGSGAMLPQVPKQQGTAELLYSHKNTLISFGLRSYSLQYDDDLNQFKLPGFATVGATAEQKLIHNITALASVDNVLDRTYLVALTPTPNTGEPRIWRLGLRWTGSLH